MDAFRIGRYVARVRAKNAYAWSEYSAPLTFHTYQRPERPASPTYKPDVPHEERITELHMVWSLPYDHNDTIIGQVATLRW